MRTRDAISMHNVDLWTFRSDKSHKRYIVEVEEFEKDFFGLKFYWKGVESSKNRYSLLTHDYEPRIIVRSCIEVMLDYYRRNPEVSFGFVAAPDLESDVRGKRQNEEEGSRRFRFYQRMMITLFGPATFRQLSDRTKTIYLMVNNRRLEDGTLTIKEVEQTLNRMFIGPYFIER